MVNAAAAWYTEDDKIRVLRGASTGREHPTNQRQALLAGGKPWQKNAIVGQSGGPTSVINASLAGVYESCKRRGAGKVYGMLHGVAGLLERRTCVLDDKLKTALDIELLKRTPSSYLGSCRYKLPDWHTAEGEAVYVQLFEILKELDIGYFFYIGGNDSMDTIGKLADYGAHIGSDIRFMGVPKTIDNDLMVTDHTPGYGSAAKYIGVVMKEIIRDATVYGTKYVTIVEIMGRNAGWLTAAAALAKAEDCEGVDMICLPEVPFNVDHFVEKVERMQKEKPPSSSPCPRASSWRMAAMSASWLTMYTQSMPSATRP